MTSHGPTPKDYDQICRLVYERSRINLGPDKQELVAARLGKRLRALNLPSYREYCRYLKSPEGLDELVNLVDVISTNHTYFFREEQHFTFLEQTVINEFVSSRKAAGDRRLRCWSAACSTGEETYSIAISLAAKMEQIDGYDWELDSSDISSRVLETARNGVYSEDRISELALDVRKRFFQKGVGPYTGFYRVKEEIRKKTRWHQLNLFDTNWPFPKPFHVIFCRNVMIYFDRPSQEDLVERLTRQLVPGGFLMIGHSESLSGVRHNLKAMHPAIYRRQA
ncbi:MAG: protein-glutamate O-methyltransferase CheR [Verrucomicrobiota bacterium]|jgi:chemotaxis protein methyltransferase CheR